MLGESGNEPRGGSCPAARALLSLSQRCRRRTAWRPTPADDAALCRFRAGTASSERPVYRGARRATDPGSGPATGEGGAKNPADRRRN